MFVNGLLYFDFISLLGLVPFCLVRYAKKVTTCYSGVFVLLALVLVNHLVASLGYVVSVADVGDLICVKYLWLV